MSAVFNEHMNATSSVPSVKDFKLTVGDETSFGRLPVFATFLYGKKMKRVGFKVGKTSVVFLESDKPQSFQKERLSKKERVVPTHTRMEAMFLAFLTPVGAEPTSSPLPLEVVAQQSVLLGLSSPESGRISATATEIAELAASDQSLD